MRRLLRAPLLHFLALGAVLLGLRTWWGAGMARDRIVLTAADVARLREGFAAEHGSPPGPATEAALVRDAIDDEVLWREALAAGLDRNDPGVRERLVRLGGFLGEDGARDRDALEREARRLGLDRNDVVVRRHLVEMMRLALARPSAADLPSDAELQAWLDDHAADFAEPATLRLTHVYLSADARGEAVAADAGRLLDELRAQHVGPDEASARGDAFIRGADVGPATVADVARVFGDEFARAVAEAPIGQWTGPVRSTYGLHLVWVLERTPGRVPPLDAVRSRVVLQLLDARGAARAAERMQLLRARYAVTVEAP